MRSASRCASAWACVSIGHDDGDHADVGHIGPAVAVHQRGGEHARHALDVGNQGHHRLHRIEGGLRHLAGQQKRDLGEADGRPDAAFEDLHQHLGRFLPGLEGVVVRRGLVGHQRVDMAHRVADQVGVHVQGDRDRHARTDACAQISAADRPRSSRAPSARIAPCSARQTPSTSCAASRMPALNRSYASRATTPPGMAHAVTEGTISTSACCRSTSTMPPNDPRAETLPATFPRPTGRRSHPGSSGTG